MKIETAVLGWLAQYALYNKINYLRGLIIETTRNQPIHDVYLKHGFFQSGPGEFKLGYPFFDLPNIIGSPHIADHVPRAIPNATKKALQNLKNFFLGKEIRGVVNRNDYLG